MCQRFGIDVSHWQGDFNFANAKNNEGVEFAIIKAGGGDDGLYKDSRFEDNYRKCVECGLPKGAYFYGNAKSVADAKKEAEYFISILSGKKYEYPVFYDVEGKMITDNDRATLTEIVKAFCEIMESGKDYSRLTTELKAKLLSLPVVEVGIQGRRSPLMVAVAQTTASLYKCFNGELRKIIYPEL